MAAPETTVLKISYINAGKPGGEKKNTEKKRWQLNPTLVLGKKVRNQLKKHFADSPKLLEVCKLN